MKIIGTTLAMTALAATMALQPALASTSLGAKPQRHRAHRQAFYHRGMAPKSLRPNRGTVITPPRGRRVSGAVITPPNKTHFPGGEVAPPAGQR